MSVPGAKNGARLFVLRRLVRLRAVRGRHRSVLGALAGARVPEPGAGAPARRARSPRSAPMRPASAGSIEYALVDRTGAHDLGRLRALQDWFLKYELKTRAERRRSRDGRRHGAAVPGRARSRPPARVRHCRSARVVEAIRTRTSETGGSVLELGEAEYMVRASGYLKSLDDFRKIPLTDERERARRCMLKDVAHDPGRARRCAAASPNSTARARSSAA